MGKIAKKTKTFNGKKPRKVVRKEKRKEKKLRKLDYYVNRKKPGKFVLSSPQKENKEELKLKPKKSTDNIDKKTRELINDKKKQQKLEKEMQKRRKKQLKEANIEEDRMIKRLEKDLKLNKRKNKSIPKSFETDGLDYLLEMCEPDNMKGVVAAEQQLHDLNDGFEEDLALITGKSNKNKKTNKTNKIEIDKKISKDFEEEDNSSNEDNSIQDEEMDFDSEDSEDMNDEKISKNKILDEDLEDDEKMNSEESDDDENIINNKRKVQSKENETRKKQKIQESSDVEDSENELEESGDDDSIKADKSETWEDIYGRTRSKDGAVIQNSEIKYVPPALRAQNNSSDDKKRAEKLSRLRKQLKGLLNRLAESNMHNIATQIEGLYMNNSRNDMNETLTQLIFDSLIAPVASPERLLLEHVMLITILNANVGTEVGANFLQNIVKKFDVLFQLDQEVENKELDNTVHVIAELYNFKVFHSQLLYQILAQLSDRFEEKHVECVLLVLKNVGFSLRKDDPLALKQLILDLQKKATGVSDDNSRVKFMLDILLAIKNNNVSKIPNYDTTYSEHLKKLLKGFVRKGNYVTQLNISLDDLLKADERGKWWVVGSAWTGMDDAKPINDTNTKLQTPAYSQKLLELARKQRMNTDIRRNIFCIIMTAEDYVDAFEKLLHLGLKNQQEREIIHVILHCCLQEKKFNPYYAVLAQKLCGHDRKYQMTIRCSVWDKLKTLTDCSGSQISNMARLLAHLFIEQGLPISTLKVVQFSELDKITLRFMRQVLLSVLLHENEESCLAVFSRVAKSLKLKTYRESLRLFIHHFLLRNLNSDVIVEDQKELLIKRAKMAEKCLTSADNKTQF